MINELLFFFLGILAGIFTGLFPGIHINLISAILTSNLALFSSVSPLPLAIFVVSMSITHTFLDFIPSILLGAPEEESFLSVLPGHQLLKEGKGYEAIFYTLRGSITGIPIFLIFTPLFIFFLPKIATLITPTIPFILIFSSCYFVLREKRIFASFFILSLSGILGYITLNTIKINQPLFPLLTGLFGLSSLILSIKNKTSLPKQDLSFQIEKIPKKEMRNAIFASVVASPLSAFLPALGSGQSSFLASELVKTSAKSFLFLIGSINTIIMSLSFITLYAIEKSRTGSAAAISLLIEKLTEKDLTIIIIAIILSAILSYIIGIKIARFSIKTINRINYFYLSISIILILLILTPIISGFLGFLILIFSSAIGLFCIKMKVKRINLMGCLLIPTIIFYLGRFT